MPGYKLPSLVLSRVSGRNQVVSLLNDSCTQVILVRDDEAIIIENKAVPHVPAAWLRARGLRTVVLEVRGRTVRY